VPTIVLNAPKIDGLFDQDDNAVARAEVGLTTESQDTAGGQLYAIRTDPVKNKKGAVVGALQVARPISWIGDTLSRLERQLALASGVGLILGALVAFLMALKSLRPIQRNLKKQREFVADASHELRTPLTLIRTNAEAWLRRAAGTSQATYAQHILEEVDQLNAIVADLTTLALADARQLRIERRPVELSGIVRELIDHTAPLAEERHVRLAPDLNGGVQVEADAIRMRQLLLILLDNALSYTPEGGEVSVSVARQNGKAKVTVADTGPGIPARDLPHIFDRFYRADKARSGEDGHIGLGLPIAKWIVDAHRGDIQVKSTPGVGTRIAVSLPAMEEEPWLLNLP
jgi:signal transduction histidine kinase